MTRQRLFPSLTVAICAIAAATIAARAAANTLPIEHKFYVARMAEAVLTIRASCSACDWAVQGREAAALRLELDGVYSQHILLTRGATAAEYSVLLGPLRRGQHILKISRDSIRSANEAGDVTVTSIDVRQVDSALEAEWLSAAPVIHARPGTVERFSDVPLAAYAEALPGNAGYRYTIVFSHEDGGTPTDRLMATWGRATDIEFVYEWERTSDVRRQVYQGRDHEILPFNGQYLGRHPLLWVSTDNNMVSDAGPPDAIRFAPAPQLLDLTGVSREVFMDEHPWLYAVMTAELAREGRIDSTAVAGSGKIPHPRRFGYIEACGHVRDATLAFDVGLESDGSSMWHPTDRGDPRFRIARSGCFRAAVPLPDGARPSDVRALRIRAHIRPARNGEAPLAPGAGAATLNRVNTIFMLDETLTPRPSGAKWIGTLAVPVDGAAIEIPIR